MCELKRGQSLSKKNSPIGDIPVVSGGKEPAFYTNQSNRDGETITVAGSGANSGYLMFWDKPIFVADAFSIKSKKDINLKYIYYFLANMQNDIYRLQTIGGVPHVYPKDVAKIVIPIPPMRVQEEIVRILDMFSELINELSAELELRKKQYYYYREKLLTFTTDTAEFLPLGEVARYEQPTKYLVKSTDYRDDYQTPVLTAGKTFILGYTYESDGIYKASQKPVIIFDDFTTANKWVDFDFKAKSSAMKIITSKDESKVLLKFIYYWLNTLPDESVYSDHKRQWISNYSNKLIPIPPIAEQERIVSILDKFDILVNSISEGIPAEINLRQKQYEYYRNALLSFN